MVSHPNFITKFTQSSACSYSIDNCMYKLQLGDIYLSFLILSLTRYKLCLDQNQLLTML